MRRQKLLIALKHAGYMLMLLTVYVLQVTPGLFSLFGVKPMPVIALAVCIAMAEGEFAGGLYGVFCGLLLDFGAFTLFGINSVLMLICGVATGLLTIYLVRDGLRSAFLLTLAAAALVGVAGYFFLYGMWNLEGAVRIFFNRTVPMIFYTSLCAIPIYKGLAVYRRQFQAQLDR
jgi:rod shape-determining protein MreD